jgi:hypothetical protein
MMEVPVLAIATQMETKDVRKWKLTVGETTQSVLLTALTAKTTQICVVTTMLHATPTVLVVYWTTHVPMQHWFPLSNRPNLTRQNQLEIQFHWEQWHPQVRQVHIRPMHQQRHLLPPLPMLQV